MKGTVKIRLRRYNDAGVNVEDREALLWDQFALIKNAGKWPWNLTYSPSGEMIGSFRIQANAKNCARLLKGLVNTDKAEAYRIFKECQAADLIAESTG